MRYRRRQQVAARHIRFCRKVFQIQPQPAMPPRVRLCPMSLHRIVQGAAKGFYQHVCGWLGQCFGRQGALPCAYLHTRAVLRRHPLQAAGVIHPQPHTLPALCQMAGQAPAHAAVTVVIDHGAENIPPPGGPVQLHRVMRHSFYKAGSWLPVCHMALHGRVTM